MPLILTSSQKHMNTHVSLSLVVEAKDKGRGSAVLDEAQRYLSNLESQISEFRSESPVFQINHAAPHKWIAVNDSFLALWTLCCFSSEVSMKSFNCLAKSRSRNPQIIVDSENRRAARGDIDTHIGFGAIGKGYALDRVREIISREGFDDFCLNAGGSSIILSGRRGDEPWRFSWSWEDGRGVELTHATLRPLALGVSGLTSQSDHLIDPKTLAPTKRVTSALIGHPSAALADSLSTALFVNGFDDALLGFSKLPDPPAIAVIENTKIPRWNGIFQNWWGALAGLVLAPLAWADETIDFSDVNDFTPYINQKNFAWVLLPALTLLWVFWHLMKPPQSRETP
ncbi:MAG: FAD:protein FMN transferase [Deltaproteobacteria bacterium]|nr:FAD:protein FMN transferase [Deltaproteobacteria bacterium]